MEPCVKCGTHTNWGSVDLCASLCPECNDAFNKWADANPDVLYREFLTL